MKKKLGITELVLRDAHQSLLATRMRIEDMLPIAESLDKLGFWSLEVWGGATFDSCIRFLGDDPWERLRRLKAAIPNTPLQMLFRAQNILGYRHYADDVVVKFVERAADNGMDVFRIFDAMNDLRNMEAAVKATINVEKHAQCALSYTVSPVHNNAMWVEMGKRLEDMGAHSICIKDMAGLLKPYVAYELVANLKAACSIPIALHCHATTGMSTAAILKAVEAGVDIVDTSISSMSLATGHSATESIVAIFEDGDNATGLDLNALESVAAYFRTVRKKYAKFEGSLRGVDSRILVAQVPGGMLTNMENQLKEQGALDKMDQVLLEIPQVRKDLGYIPLVTPTSQIVGTQAVFNVLTGERYKNIAKETAGVLKGTYGATPGPVNKALQERVLDGEDPVTCRPADLLEPEVDRLTEELKKLAQEKGFALAENVIDDVLIYALFPQVGLDFLQNRGNPGVFEPIPGEEPAATAAPIATTVASQASVAGTEYYQVVVNNTSYDVEVSPAGQVERVATTAMSTAASAPIVEAVVAPMTGNIFKVLVQPGQQVAANDVVVIMEAMKMEAEVRSTKTGTVDVVMVQVGDSVSTGDAMLTLK